jgi:alanine racemase
MPRPLVATINLDAMRSNLALARRQAGHAKVWAIVKANAYGHGLERAMRAFANADGLALVELDNAIKLREWGWTKPILLLEGFFEPAELAVLINYGIVPAIHNEEQLRMLEAHAFSTPIDVHLKMNTGMNRLGFKPEAFRQAYARLRALPTIRYISMLTHFANAEIEADNPVPLKEQVRRFHAACEGLLGERSLANSAACLLHPELSADWIRPGIMLYGATPGAKDAAAFGLRPAMTLTSTLISVQELLPGEAVGYGSTFVADKSMRIGIVACGYADGYPRHAPAGTPVLVEGVKTRIAGRVSMDMLTVDLTPVPHAQLGSPVVLWGEGLPIDEVAQAAGTVGYELMCALMPRVRVVEC